MPRHPVLPEDQSRTVRWVTQLSQDAADTFRKIAGDRELTDSALLRSLVLAEIQAETGYRDTARRYTPYRRRAQGGVPVIAVRLSAEESGYADQVRGDTSRWAWLRGLAERFLAASGHQVTERAPVARTRPTRPSLPPLAPFGDLDPGQRRAAAAAAKEQGYSLTEIGAAFRPPVSHQRVSQMLKQNRTEEEQP